VEDEELLIGFGALAASSAVFDAIKLSVKFNVVEVFQVAPEWAFARTNSAGNVTINVPILAVRPASLRLSAKVRIFIEHLEKTFALCSQFNPRPS